MKIGIIGAGVIGLATGGVLGDKHEVSYYDPFKREFSNSLSYVARNAEVVFSCVPTPMKPSGEMDYSMIGDSLDKLSSEVENVGRDPKDLIAVIRSTAVPGTSDELSNGVPFEVAYNPEFLREKYAEEDMRNTDRVVIGSNNGKVRKKIKNMYREVFPNANYVLTDTKTAEMIKYSANVMLALQISGACELYRICQADGIDYDVVKNAMLLDERIGRNIDVPGHDGKLGFGGKCFPKDLKALIHHSHEIGVEPNLLEEVWKSNLEIRGEEDWQEIKGATTGNNYSQ